MYMSSIFRIGHKFSGISLRIDTAGYLDFPLFPAENLTVLLTRGLKRFAPSKRWLPKLAMLDCLKLFN